MDWLARLVTHIPGRYEHTVRYYGDFFWLPSNGSGYDLVLACATLNFAKSKLSDIVQRVHSALNPGDLLHSPEFQAFSTGHLNPGPKF